MPSPLDFYFFGMNELPIRRDEELRIKEKFELWRRMTLDMIENEHSDHQCILQDAKDLISRIKIIPSILRGGMNSSIRAWVKPEKSLDTMWINATGGRGWDIADGITTIIHESLHLHKNTSPGKNTSFCGPDAVWSMRPLCILFGKEVHISSQITQAITNHLIEYSKDESLKQELIKFDRFLTPMVSRTEAMNRFTNFDFDI